MKKVIYALWRLIYPAIIYLLVSAVVETCFSIHFTAKYAATITDIDALNDALVDYITTNGLIITTIVNAILFPIYVWLLKGDEKKRIASGCVQYKKPYIHQLVLVIVLGMSSAIGVNALVSLSGIAALSKTYDEVSQILYSGGIALEMISAVVAAPVVEELLFRGLVYKRLRDYTGPTVAIIVSSAVFGLFHGNLVQFVYAFIIGCMLAYTYEKLKTIVAPMIFHVSANLIAVLITELVSEEYMLVIIIVPLMVVCLAAMVIILSKMRKWQAEPVDQPVGNESSASV